MRTRFAGFGLVLSSVVTLALGGCSGTVRAQALSASAAPVASPAPMTGLATAARAAEVGPAAVGILAGAAATDAAGASGELQPSREMLDIEGTVTLQVQKMKPALRALHALTARVGGVVTQERLDTSSASDTAQVTVRLPSGKAQNLIDELDAIGSVVEQSIEARDVGKEYFDAKVRLSSLEVTLHRYEEVLTHATKVEELLRIEQELGRLRTEIEQVKGTLRWLSDRAARATLHLALREKPPAIVQALLPPPAPEPEPQFYPGVRVPLLVDFGKHATQGYLGGGLSLRFSRALSLDLDLLERPGSDERGPDALLATVGGEIYSELLGGGERRFLNPYLGWRAGYARFDQDNQALLGATLGLELYKNRWLGLDAEARNYLIVIGDRAAHYGLVPALSARLAF